METTVLKLSEARRMVSENQEYQKKLASEIERVNSSIKSAIKQGKTDTCFNVKPDFEDAVRKLFSEEGYTFKPTGIIGGVYQDTDQICW